VKILQISSADSLGGGERHLADLANGLAARGHNVYAALRPNSPLIAELKNLPNQNLIQLSLRNSLDAKSARDLAKFVRKNQIQIIHAHMARDYPLAAYAARRNPDSRLIITRHVLFQLNRLHRVTLSRAARIIGVSQAVAAQLRTDAVAPAERISVVLNGIDASRFAIASERFDRRQFLREWGFAEDSLLVGTVGELTPLKGQSEFLKAVPEIVKEFPNAHFIIAGKDNSSANTNGAVLQELIIRLNLTQRVKIVDWLEDIAQLYCALDVFVSASHTESFGLAIAEAMAAGTAVVATETGGVREIVQPGETGLLVRVADVEGLVEAVLELLRDRNKRVRMGEAAKRLVKKEFGVERMIDETERIYSEELEK
jgi:glycosyltransferase involved in cell wall biosynthesis